MKLYSYVVRYDFGFAPNPFHGVCTLATCKQVIRGAASVGDWVIGTGASTKYSYTGRLIYAMQVSEVLTFDEYWNDPRFFRKRPNLKGSLKVVYGDNIYHRDGEKWIQADSRHKSEDGTPNEGHLTTDTKANRVLIATKFVYWGKDAPVIPEQFRSFGEKGEDICFGRGHKWRFSDELTTAFVEWLEKQGKWGVMGGPLEFEKHSPLPKD